MHRFAAAAAAALFFTGCGYVGGPLPPLANIPAAVTDLAAVQRGNRIYVHFTVPTQTTEGVLLKSPPRLDLRIGTASSPFNAGQWAEQAKPVPAGAIDKGVASYQIPSAEWTGKDAILGVRIAGTNGKESDWSNYAIVSVVPPPQKPAAVHAESSVAGVRLTWTGAGDRFRIFRKTADTPFAPAADVTGVHEWTDHDTEFGKPYTYIVQALVDKAESDPSDPIAFTPTDTFPPAAPTGLTASAAPNSIEVAWEQNTEPDLAGYRVYRAAPGGDFEKLADTSLVPTYSDKAVERGKSYRYVVTAIDRNGNESQRSAVVEAALQ
jgi:hypothetical protein